MAVGVPSALVRQMVSPPFFGRGILQSALSGYGAAETGDTGSVGVGDRWSYDIMDALAGDLMHAITNVVDEEVRVASTMLARNVHH